MTIALECPEVDALGLCALLNEVGIGIGILLQVLVQVLPILLIVLAVVSLITYIAKGVGKMLTGSVAKHM